MTQQSLNAHRVGRPVGAARHMLGTLALAALALLGSLPAHATDARGRPQPVAPRLDSRDQHHGDRDHHGKRWGVRGHPKIDRPGVPHHPPRPVVVVPPCKRGGHSITPC